MMSKSLKVASEHIETVKSALKRQGFRSQKELAENLGLSPATISNFINGKPVNEKNFLAICERLELDSSAITIDEVQSIDDSDNEQISFEPELLFTLKGHKDEIYAIAWSPDGKLLASGGKDKTIYIWDATTGNLLKTLKGHTKSVFCLAFSPDGQMLSSGSEDTTIRLWDCSSWNTINILQGHLEQVNSLAWSPIEQKLASASSDDTVILW